MEDQVAVHGTKTTVGISDVVAGTFTPIGNLNGEIPMPISEREISEFMDNDADGPIQHASASKVSAIELAVTYQDHAQYEALAAADDGETHFLKFTLENGDWYTYRGMVNKIAPVGSFEEGFAIATFGFKPAALAASGAAVP